MNNIIIQVLRDEKGRISNSINHEEFIQEMNISNRMPDIYFAFIIKSLIDDFGSSLTKATKGKINKEQFEAQFLDNLKTMMPEKTRIDECK